jgi:hypothetical protein
MMRDIAALQQISLSELRTMHPKYTEDYVKENPEEIKGILFDLGLNTNEHFEAQHNTHRNRFNNPVTCTRWVGSERVDSEWLESGYASQLAIDKSKGNKLLVDLYSTKGLTTDRLGGVWEDEDKG